MDPSLKIPCTLIPVGGYHLLLPNSGIAEVLICKTLDTYSHAPRWLCGSIRWQKKPLYIIDFAEMANNGDKKSPTINKKQTVIIIRNSEHDESTSPTFLGIVVKGNPKVIEVTSLNLDKNKYPDSHHDHAINYVDINHIEAIIPNISTLIKAIEELNLH